MANISTRLWSSPAMEPYLSYTIQYVRLAHHGNCTAPAYKLIAYLMITLAPMALPQTLSKWKLSWLD